MVAVIITMLAGLTFFVSKQTMRQMAFDPQIQVAEDLANQLRDGRSGQASLNKVEITRSLAQFTIMLDKSGKLTSSTALLDGQAPIISPEILNGARDTGESRVTWQPKKGQRFAVVVRYYAGQGEGYVIIGRSLREVENRINDLGNLVLMSWLATMAVSFGSVVIMNRL